MTQRVRRLSQDEARLWARVARTVAPLPDKLLPDAAEPAKTVPAPAKKAITPVRPAPPAAPPQSAPRPAPPRPLDRHGLDGSWERKLTHGTLAPDFTLDLHGHGLDGAHARLDAGLGQALTMGARVVLVITGRPRPVEAADRSSHRGAIRAKLIDWLAEGSYASRIATVRAAHRRHGGAGAVYVILKRPR
jgi:DNA-nicking Smr family endonuclease